MKKLNGTIVECCTAYGGKRQNVQKHWKAIEERGYKKIADKECHGDCATEQHCKHV